MVLPFASCSCGDHTKIGVNKDLEYCIDNNKKIGQCTSHSHSRPILYICISFARARWVGLGGWGLGWGGVGWSGEGRGWGGWWGGVELGRGVGRGGVG